VGLVVAQVIQTCKLYLVPSSWNEQKLLMMKDKGQLLMMMKDKGHLMMKDKGQLLMMMKDKGQLLMMMKDKGHLMMMKDKGQLLMMKDKGHLMMKDKGQLLLMMLMRWSSFHYSLLMMVTSLQFESGNVMWHHDFQWFGSSIVMRTLQVDGCMVRMTNRCRS